MDDPRPAAKRAGAGEQPPAGGAPAGGHGADPVRLAAGAAAGPSPAAVEGERAVIDRLTRRLAPAGPGEVWIGDDAAVLAPPPGGGQLLLAADAVVEGVHFDLALVGLADVGWKALAVNVSDLAAMGGRPLAAVVSVIGASAAGVDELYDGLVAAASRYGCAVVGGDLSGGASLVVSVAVTGTCDGRRPVLRSGARPGDLVFVTGPLGRSAAGLAALRASAGGDAAATSVAACVAAHRRPEALVAAGAAAALGGATAMIDVSDGLGVDLDRLAVASGVGVELHRLPVADGVDSRVRRSVAARTTSWPSRRRTVPS